jgi:hypothetical protein
MRSTLALPFAIALLCAACGADEPPPFTNEVDNYWLSLDPDQQTAFCLGLTEYGSGYAVVGALSDGDGIIDLLDGGEHADTHDNRKLVGAAFDALHTRECPQTEVDT